MPCGENRREVADAEQALLEGPTAWLDLSKADQVGIERGELVIQVIDYCQPGCHDLTPGGGKIDGCELSPALRCDRRDTWHSLMEELGLHPLLPLPARISQGLAKPHQGADPEHVRRGQPGLVKATGTEQVHHVVAITAIGLGSPLRSAERGGVGRLGEMRDQPHPGELFRHKAPSGRGLQGEVGVETLEGYEEFSDRLPDSRHDAASLDLASLGVQPFVCDLLPMHVECTYNPHWDLLDSSARTLGP